MTYDSSFWVGPRAEPDTDQLISILGSGSEGQVGRAVAVTTTTVTEEGFSNQPAPVSRSHVLPAAVLTRFTGVAGYPGSMPVWTVVDQIPLSRDAVTERRPTGATAIQAAVARDKCGPVGWGDRVFLRAAARPPVRLLTGGAPRRRFVL